MNTTRLIHVYGDIRWIDRLAGVIYRLLAGDRLSHAVSRRAIGGFTYTAIACLTRSHGGRSLMAHRLARRFPVEHTGRHRSAGGTSRQVNLRERSATSIFLVVSAPERI